MNVRTSSSYSIVASLLFAFVFLAPSGLAANDAQRPNIILVFIDDMGWGDFSCFGNEAVETKQIDALAKE
ncbi:MAG: sulfatase-like hydrolase/transferase, partial [bacterium]|nr:sulfatase-like hydrolase/transferase [bacterium]